MAVDRPIPAFYCCYLLRSIVRGAHVYVGSTPNPVRRLRQHNGDAKGGAVRTSRPSLRPWEMACIVSGFPSHIAALQFEWAWQNPHITLHIPPESRIQHSTAKKSGHPRRPRHTISSLLSNLHLLLRVPSFSRWPLEVRFFSEDVHKSWLKWTKTTPEPLRDSLPVVLDFAPKTSGETGKIASLSEDEEEGARGIKRQKTSRGIGVLDINYSTNKPHVEKGKNIVEFEREGSCAICRTDLEHDAGIYTICPNPDCEAVSHLTCLSKHFLSSADEDALVPIAGSCPSCHAEHKWVDVVKELSLRMRGQKEVEKLLKKKRARKVRATLSGSQAMLSSESEDEEADRQEDEERNDFVPVGGTGSAEATDEWHQIDDSEDSDTGSIISTASMPTSALVAKSKPRTTKPATGEAKKGKAKPTLSIVIEDSDWDDADALD